MKYRFIADDQYYRTIPAVMLDAREGTPLANKQGFTIKAFTDTEVIKATAPNVIPYKIEAITNGGLVGYLTLLVNNGSAIPYQQVIRPNFQGYIGEITAEISTFITGNDWQYDSLQ